MIYVMFIVMCFLYIGKTLTEKSLRERIKFLKEQLEKRDKR